jgi:5,6-dimethylbenzimidazole synthase
VRALLAMPPGAKPVAILCVGQVSEFYPRPMLEMEKWAERKALGECVFENHWPQDETAPTPTPHAAPGD